MNTTCICVLNYNNGLKTTRCISSVLDQTSKNFRLIIIDNNSIDDSLLIIQDFLRRNQVDFKYAEQSDVEGDLVSAFWDVLVVRSQKNGGYSCGNNIAIRIARSMNIFSNLLIINNDVVLKENFLEEMIKRYEDMFKLGNTGKIALGATELGATGRIHHNGFHYIHLLSGITFTSPYFPSFKFINGSCIFLDIEAPLMDESFFLYFDDVEYSKILRRENYILENSPLSQYIHEPGGTYKKDLQWLIFKSLVRFYLLNYPFLLPVVVPLRLLLILYLRIKTIIP